MKRQKDTFVFPAELGQRLKELRLRARLTQAELAGLMGRAGYEARNLVSRLELGRVRHPTFSTIADYLRACRAKFAEITDILDKYTWQPTIVEKQGTKIVERMLRDLPDRVARPVWSYDVKTKMHRSSNRAAWKR